MLRKSLTAIELPWRLKQLTLVAGIDLTSPLDKRPAIGASVTEPWGRGKVALRANQGADPVAEWTRSWVFPGLLDAATRVQVRSTLNLRTGRGDADVRLGLRRTPRGPGVALVHRVALEGTPASIDIGVTVIVPEELKVDARSGLSQRGGQRGSRLLAVDLDTLDLCVDA